MYPDDMHQIKVDYLKGIDMVQLLNVASHLGIEHQKSQLTFIIKHLYDLFIDRDLDIVEINPLILTDEHKLCVASTHMKINDNSRWR
jgi:succinyl-CoA synthetase beta subunit